MSLTGGFNKIRRNYAASKAKTEFEKRIIKATFEKDTKEPKGKHVEYIINSLMGKNLEITPSEAFSQFFVRFLDNMESWVHVIKCYTIFHVALQLPKIGAKIAGELRKRTASLVAFSKKPEVDDFAVTRHQEISKIYCEYIKSMSVFMGMFNVLNIQLSSIQKHIQMATTSHLFQMYKKLEELILLATKLYQYSVFVQKYRIYKNQFQLMYEDISHIYTICYIAISELLKRFQTLGLEDAKQTYLIYTNFQEVTSEVKNKIGMMESALQLTLKPLNYLVTEDKVCKSLKDYIEGKEEHIERINLMEYEEEKEFKEKGEISGVVGIGISGGKERGPDWSSSRGKVEMGEWSESDDSEYDLEGEEGIDDLIGGEESKVVEKGKGKGKEKEKGQGEIDLLGGGISKSPPQREPPEFEDLFGKINFPQEPSPATQPPPTLLTGNKQSGEVQDTEDPYAVFKTIYSTSQHPQPPQPPPPYIYNTAQPQPPYNNPKGGADWF